MPKAESTAAPSASGPVSDAELLAKAYAQVIPIRGHLRVVHEHPRRGANNPRRLASEARGLGATPALSDGDPATQAPVDAFRRPGVSSEALRRLRRHSDAIRECLDLHGLTRDQARAAVSHFVKAAAHAGVTRLRIVHGQGYGSASGIGVLRHQTRHWLTQLPEVLAFATPPAHSGGTGAVLVLLKSGQATHRQGSRP